MCANIKLFFKNDTITSFFLYFLANKMFLLTIPHQNTTI